MFPAIEPDDVQALTACIDWVVERLEAALMKVLVAEKIGASGVQLLREHFEVDDRRRRATSSSSASASTTGMLIRSATKVTPTLIETATKLKAIGRAGVGVDNVDVPAATKRGIVVANAPQSNVVTAAEHTMALLLALARNVPQAHASLVDGSWERSQVLAASSCIDKTLGILGFGRIGQLVAQRAQGFGMRVIAFDPFVGAERYRELGVEKAETSDDVYADRRLHHRPPAQDAGDRGLARRRGARQDARTACASSTSPAGR